jgi:hypothetical protein
MRTSQKNISKSKMVKMPGSAMVKMPAQEKKRFQGLTFIWCEESSKRL